MDSIVPIIILIIILVQLFFFVKNYLRMRQFNSIFTDTSSWELSHDKDSRLVNGVCAKGNKIFTAIIISINKYLGHNTGSVIDFALLKDAVDRHCDSVENDIAVQTPIPLYWGLAGTMAGVIIGLWDLLDSNAIMTLMSSSGGIVEHASMNAASGINSLLSGVAWAMVASICGILLTTVNSLLFKRCKQNEENGKNSFLAWMQSELLPELPSDTSEALNKLVQNLNKFNIIFAKNTSKLGETLSAVNTSYAMQAGIIEAVHDMDVRKMATANVRVLKELGQCTDKLELFNQYLHDIEGYTTAIHRFESLYNEQANQIHILEEIRDFFRRHKGEIAKTTADADRTLQESLQNIKKSTSLNVNELNKSFVEQSESFKQFLRAEKELFEKFSHDITVQFNAQMTQMPQMPQLSKQLEEISVIPARLDRLIDKMETSNAQFAKHISEAVKKSLSTTKTNEIIDTSGNIQVGTSIPVWMKVSGWFAIVIIALTCILNVIFMFFPDNKHQTQSQQSHLQPIVTQKDSVNKQAFTH